MHWVREPGTVERGVLFGHDGTNPVRDGALAVRRHQLQRHIVEREHHAIGAVGIAPRRRTREQGLTG